MRSFNNLTSSVKRRRSAPGFLAQFFALLASLIALTQDTSEPLSQGFGERVEIKRAGHFGCPKCLPKPTVQCELKEAE
jgi:hypothetical protein